MAKNDDRTNHGSEPGPSGGFTASPLPVSSAVIPPPSRPPAWGFWPTFLFSLLVGVVNGLAAILAVFIVLDVAILSDPNFNWTDYIFSGFDTEFGPVVVVSVLLSGVVSLVLIAGLIKAKYGATIKEYLALKPLPFKTMAKLVALTLGLVVVSAIVDTFRTLPEDAAAAGSIYDGVWPVFVWLAVVGMAPLFEEVMFRGFMFQGFLRTRLGPALAIVLPAMWWGLLHAQYGGFDQMVIMVFGVVLAVTRLKTGSLWGPIGMHATWNMVAMIQTTLAS
jgi:hypothetical protein